MKPDLHWILLMRGHQVTGTNHLWVQFASVMTRQNCIEFWCALSVVDVFFVLSISALIIPLLFCFITLCPVLLFLLFSVSLCLWSLWFPAHPSNSVQFCCIFLGGVLFCVARGGLAFYWNRITCFNVKIYIYFFSILHISAATLLTFCLKPTAEYSTEHICAAFQLCCRCWTWSQQILANAHDSTRHAATHFRSGSPLCYA